MSSPWFLDVTMSNHAERSPRLGWFCGGDTERNRGAGLERAALRQNPPSLCVLLQCWLLGIFTLIHGHKSRLLSPDERFCILWFDSVRVGGVLHCWSPVGSSLFCLLSSHYWRCISHCLVEECLPLLSDSELNSWLSHEWSKGPSVWGGPPNFSWIQGLQLFLGTQFQCHCKHLKMAFAC